MGSISRKHKNITLVITAFLLSSLACIFFERLVIDPQNIKPQETIQTTQDSCAGDECLDICLENLENVLETRPFEPLTNEIYVESNANFKLVVYKVEGNEMLEPSNLWVPPDYLVYQEDTAAHQRIWDFYISVIPAEQRTMVKSLVIYTDGARGSTASVEPFLNKPAEWQVGFDILDSEVPLYLTDALIHETGHLITLNTAQIPFDELLTYTDKQNHPKCSNYINVQGCSLPDSYINNFYQRFWKEIYEEWWEIRQQAKDADTFEEFQSLQDPFYQSHPNEFVSRYAATNIEEDIAASWTLFVLTPKPEESEIASQKILFFYEFPELVDLRKEIIDGLCSYIIP